MSPGFDWMLRKRKTEVEWRVARLGGDQELGSGHVRRSIKAFFVYAATILPVLNRNRMTAAQQAIKAAASVPATINNPRGGQLFLSGTAAKSTT
jgi:hypothetical protein